MFMIKKIIYYCVMSCTRLEKLISKIKKYCIHVLAWVFGDMLLRNTYLNFVIDKFLTFKFYFFMVKYIS